MHSRRRGGRKPIYTDDNVSGSDTVTTACKWLFLLPLYVIAADMIQLTMFLMEVIAYVKSQ
jgi:hypothetical protein